MNEDELENDATDTVVAVARSVAGIIPGAGPLVTEILTTVIPNQRIDRICSFLKELNKRIRDLEMEQLKHNQYFVDLFEDGVFMASRALTEDRNKYIAIFLSKSKNVSSDEYGTRKKLLHLLEELTDKDIEILRDFSIGELHTYSKHRVPSVTVGTHTKMTEDEKYESDIRQVSLNVHINTLVRLNLLIEKRDFSHLSDSKEYSEYIERFLDEETGLARITGHDISDLGKVLLTSIEE